MTDTTRRTVGWKRHFIVFWVFVGAMASAVFAVMIIMTLGGTYYFRVIPLWAIQVIVDKWWPFIVLGEITLQIIPMAVRYQTQSWDVVADQWTSWIPGAACLFVPLQIFVFGTFSMGGEGWRLWGLSVFAALIELLLQSLSNKLIAAARGSEETSVR